jgi:uncharacterized glyoxalase superfamily protein PhnB
MADDVSPVVPFLHYADLDAAAEWLPRVFGLTVRSVDKDAAGLPSMAVFQHGTGLIFARQVASATGLTGGRLYLYVDDVDAHHAAACAQGADASAPGDAPWGDRVYNVRDLQGHPWTFASPVRPA